MCAHTLLLMKLEGQRSNKPFRRNDTIVGIEGSTMLFNKACRICIVGQQLRAQRPVARSNGRRRGGGAKQMSRKRLARCVVNGWVRSITLVYSRNRSILMSGGRSPLMGTRLRSNLGIFDRFKPREGRKNINFIESPRKICKILQNGNLELMNSLVRLTMS